MMSPLWQAAIATWDGIPDSNMIARRTGGLTDTIGALAAVALPDDAYAVRFDAQTIAFMVPANRQLVVRWVREVLRQAEPNVSNYLLQASAFAEESRVPIVMALDLRGVATEEGIRVRLKQRWKHAGFEERLSLDGLDEIAHVLASIRGATLDVTFKDEPFGTLQIDFARQVAPLAPMPQALAG